MREGHPAALVTPEGPVDFQRFGFQGACWYLIKNMMRIEGAVIAADTGMVAANVVLPVLSSQFL